MYDTHKNFRGNREKRDGSVVCDEALVTALIHISDV